MECAVQFRSPNYMNDQKSLEKVQKRGTSLQSKTQESMTEVFKILNQLDEINTEKAFN